MHVLLNRQKALAAINLCKRSLARRGTVSFAYAAFIGACNGGTPTLTAGGGEGSASNDVIVATSPGAGGASSEEPTSSDAQLTGGAAGVAATSEASASGGASGITASGGSDAIGGTAATSSNGCTDCPGSNTTAGDATGGATASATGGANAATGGWTVVHVPNTTVKKFVGNITTGVAGAADYNGMTYSTYWDQITPENAGKWGSVQSSAEATFKWSTLDAIYKYAQTNNIIFKEHTFVWGRQQPTGTLTQANVENWIKSFCERYPDTKLIDVVNEPPPHTTPSYLEALGTGESGTYAYITKAFKLAAQYCGNAILILNDYNDIEFADDLNRIIDIVQQVTAAGGPIDAVGAQAHGTAGLTAAQLQVNLDFLHTQTGLPVYITEYDVNDASDSGQLATYQEQFPVFWNSTYVHGITLWGWIYGKTWVQASGLVNGTDPRPAMTWLMQTLQRAVPAAS